MNNCYNCLNSQPMGVLMGCKDKKQIIINPNDEKTCCVERPRCRDFNDIIDIVNKDMKGRKR